MPDRNPTTTTPQPDPAALPDGTQAQDAAQAALSAAMSHSDLIPGYEILGELGRGSMGVVYRARQVTLNRQVALKMMLRADASRTTVARFWVEAEVMAAVKHPHVVQVFELGEHDGRPFMVMEFVAGGSLADRLLASDPFAPRAAAEVLEKIARGVAAAHELGIVHRDLKPGNVLLDARGEPKVSDFGIAKRQAHDLTRTQAVMGTPAYMAPEQAAGRAKFVGPQADVWALGVILYECVAGVRPFHADSTGALLAQIQSAEPVPLRERVRGVPRDLDTVVSKCLAKDPNSRYATACDLADDLDRFVRHEPITARPAGWWKDAARWVQREPWTALGGAVVLLVVLTYAAMEPKPVALTALGVALTLITAYAAGSRVAAVTLAALVVSLWFSLSPPRLEPETQRTAGFAILATWGGILSGALCRGIAWYYRGSTAIALLWAVAGAVAGIALGGLSVLPLFFVLGDPNSGERWAGLTRWAFRIWFGACVAVGVVGGSAFGVVRHSRLRRVPVPPSIPTTDWRVSIAASNSKVRRRTVFLVLSGYLGGLLTSPGNQLSAETPPYVVLGVAFFGFALLGAFGVNVWVGGILDPNRDDPAIDRPLQSGRNRVDE